MKHLFLFLLLPLFVSAQDVTKDTSYLINSGGNFFNVTRIEYDNGAYSENSTLVGDTASVVSLYANSIASQAQQYSSAAVIAMRAQSVSASLLKLDTMATQRLLQSPLTSVMNSYEREFLQGDWEVQYNSTNTPVTFPRLQSNKRIRIMPAGGSARTFLIFGTMARMVNYPVSGINILFKVRDGRWENITRTIVLRRTNNR